MGFTSSDALLLEAPQGRHFCQLHKSPAALTAAVAAFVETGLRRRDAVIVVASPARNRAIRSHLAGCDVDVASCEASGMLSMHESAVVLARFMHGEQPHAGDFRAVIVPLIEAAQQSGAKRIRIYGEMVNDLWRSGNPKAAIQLEEYWNELARTHRFSLFCGYEMNGLDEASYGDPISEIGRTHSDILATDDDGRFLDALDSATREILGAPASAMLTYSGVNNDLGSHRLPVAHRTVLWLQRNMPSAMTKVLKRARHYYEQSAASAVELPAD